MYVSPSPTAGMETAPSSLRARLPHHPHENGQKYKLWTQAQVQISALRTFASCVTLGKLGIRLSFPLCKTGI